MNRHSTDGKILARHIIFSWSVLFFSVFLFTVFALAITPLIQNRGIVVIISFIITASINLITQIIFHKRLYYTIINKSTEDKRDKENAQQSDGDRFKIIVMPLINQDAIKIKPKRTAMLSAVIKVVMSYFRRFT